MEEGEGEVAFPDQTANEIESLSHRGDLEKDIEQLQYLAEPTTFDQAIKSLGLTKEMILSNIRGDTEKKLLEINFRIFQCALTDFGDLSDEGEREMVMCAFEDLQEFLSSRCSFEGWARELLQRISYRLEKAIAESDKKKKRGVLG